MTLTIQTGDWKGEKHVPTIIVESATAEEVKVKVHVGEEIPHPNTFDHHIAWIKLFFQPEGGKFPIEVGSYDFSAHGESEVFTEPLVIASFKTPKGGTLQAISYCNIHGLWESSEELKLG